MADFFLNCSPIVPLLILLGLAVLYVGLIVLETKWGDDE